VISFGRKVVTACGPGDRVHRDRRGQKAEDANDLGRPGSVWKMYNVYNFFERAARGNVPTPRWPPAAQPAPTLSPN
jgi:hypothetical protein